MRVRSLLLILVAVLLCGQTRPTFEQQRNRPFSRVPNQNRVVIDGLAAYWDFTQGPAQALYDLSGNGHHLTNGTTSGLDTRDAVLTGVGLYCGGSREYLNAAGAATIAHHADFACAAPWSIEVVIRPTDGVATQYVLVKNVDDGVAPLNSLAVIYGYVANKIELYSNFVDIRTDSQVSLTPDGKSHDVVYVYTGTRLYAYLDGAPVVDVAKNVVIPAGTGPLWISNAKPTVGFSGNVLAVAWYTKALSAAEVARNTAYHKVLSAKRGPNASIVFDGDSLTSGYNWGYTGSDYPAQAITLTADPNFRPIYSNLGISGDQITAFAGHAPDLHLNDANGRKILLAWGGSNDMAGSIGNVDGDTAHTRLLTYFSGRRTAGWQKLVAFTVISRGDAAGGVDFLSRRGVFNTAVRNDCGVGTTASVIHTTGSSGKTYRCGAGSPFEYLADLASDSNIGVDGAESNLTYFQNDLCHLNGTGYSIVAEMAAAALLDCCTSR